MEIKERLKKKIYETVKKYCPNKQTGIAFSGGVDSSLLAKVCKDLKKDVILLTVGFQESEDPNQARKAAEELDLPLFVKWLKVEDIEQDIKKIFSVNRSKSLLDLELALGFYYIARLASENGVDAILTASGTDELFCGYNMYNKILATSGSRGVKEAIKVEVKKALKNRGQQRKVTRMLGVKKIDPFLSKEFIAFGLEVPVKLKIKGPEDDLRKQIIRRIALDIGIPKETALKHKRALQYGSGIHKQIERVANKMINRIEAKKRGFESPLEAYLSEIYRKSNNSK